MAEPPARVPGQEAEAENPEDGERDVVIKVVFGWESAKEVEGAADEEGDDCEEGGGKKLGESVRMFVRRGGQ